MNKATENNTCLELRIVSDNLIRTNCIPKKEYDRMKKISESDTQLLSFEDVLNEQGYFVYTNVGFSMMPLLRQKKDIIEIHKKGQGRCKKYDVVLYKRREQYVLHRILRVLPEGYLIAGDHCTFVERDIKDDNIIGVMTRVLRNGKYITPDNIWYKMYVHLWCDFYPARMFLIKAKAFVYKCLSFVKRRVLRIQ